MKWLGYKNVRISTILKPGDWRALLREPRIAALAASIAEDGNIAPSVIRKSTLEIVAGKDRLAAQDFLRAEYVEVRLWEGTDAEMLRVRLAENFHRREFSPRERDQMRAEFEKLVEQFSARSENSEASGIIEASPSAPRGPGRPKKPEREALRTIAAKRGVSERAIEKAIAPKKGETKPEPKKGLAMPDAGELLRGGLNTLHTTLARAQAICTDLLKKLPAEYADRCELDRLHRQIHQAAVSVKQEIPVRVCPYCKLVKARMKDCAGCKGTGYLVGTQVESVPKELLIEGENAGIFIKPDVFVRLADL